MKFYLLQNENISIKISLNKRKISQEFDFNLIFFSFQNHQSTKCLHHKSISNISTHFFSILIDLS